jgi:hypothetical protein
MLHVIERVKLKLIYVKRSNSGKIVCLKNNDKSEAQEFSSYNVI